MKGVHRPLTELIKAMSQFEIPVFQRDYSWRASEHCAQLWNDVLRAGRPDSLAPHFLGTIVGIPAQDYAMGFNRCQVVDGQQRLTTVALLLLALRDHLSDDPSQLPEGCTPALINSSYLCDFNRTGEQKYRILLRRHDRETLCHLIDGIAEARDVSKNVTATYRFFRDELKTADTTAVWRGIHSLIVVEVTLDEKDNPQKIFESLNTTGLTLSKSDLIRNYILMGLRPQHQERLWQQYWRPIEDLFREAPERVFDDFARDYADVRTERVVQTKSERVYGAFQDFWADEIQKRSVEDGLRDMLRHAHYYADFRLGREADSKRRIRYDRIRQLGSVPAIAVMRLRECRERIGTSAEVDFLESLDLIESFLVRGAICGWTDRAYNKIFAFLAASIRDASPFEDFKGGLGLQREGYVFPTDREFLRALRENNLYRRRRLCKFVLDRLEHHDNKNQTDTSDYTIEHILPQNPSLNNEWTDALGADWQKVQETWMHRLGNLTLTAYNSEYSDRPFTDKKEMERGFLESALKINGFVNKQKAWTAREIEIRTDDLAKEALSIWPPLRAGSLVEQARLREKVRRTAGRTAESVKMDEDARHIFRQLSDRVSALGVEVVEVPESRSISYHRPGYFLEVVPRKGYVELLLALPYEAGHDPTGRAKDLGEWAWVSLSQYKKQSGTIFSLSNEDELDAALHLVEQAYRRAAPSGGSAIGG